MTHSNHDSAKIYRKEDLFLGKTNQVNLAHLQQNGLFSIVPHARTLRKAREQVKLMVADGNSTQQIRNYLRLWSMWWVQTSEIWDYQTLLTWLLQSCWKNNPARNYAAGLLILLKREEIQTIKDQALMPCPIRARQAQTFL
jgi:hypothetical protein